MTDQVATWRMVVAGAIVAGLGLGLGAVALSSEAAPRHVGPPSLVAILPSTTPPAPSVTVAATTPSAEDVADGVRSAVAAALEAWGTFAGSGDLNDIDPFFD
ncbi:MAG: hypothetical protein OEY55_14645, partial [Acidimicrobiia bacterium]|nr:hypothetical protein [Acidimicrobiia bacterium]